MSFKTYQVQEYNFIKVNIGEFEVILSSLGASIFSIKYCGQYMTSNPNEEDFIKSNNYFGKTIGRVTNRIQNNLTISGIKYPLDANEEDIVLHGGTNGLSFKDFNYEIVEKYSETAVIFTYLSPHLESGFPGNLRFKVTYIIKENSINIIYEAACDEDTVFSITNHTFYCLGESNLDELSLCINSSKFVHPNEQNLLPSEIRNVNETMDFRHLKKIKNILNNEYLINSRTNGIDHFYIFDEIDVNKTNVILSSNNFRLLVNTDFEGTQIYSDNYPNDFLCLNSSNKIRRGVAIEPSSRTNELHFLKTGERYHHEINLVFNKK